MDIKDLQEAYLEYKLGRFTAKDLAEYNQLFLNICEEYGWNTADIWQQAKFEQEYVLDNMIPYNDSWEWISPLSGLHYKESSAIYPETDRPGDFVLINNEWRIL